MHQLRTYIVPVVFSAAIMIAANTVLCESFTAEQATQRGVRLVGRWLPESSAFRCQWPCCGLEFVHTGKQLSLEFEDSAPGHPHEIKGFQSNYLDVIIEGLPKRVLRLEPGRKRYTIVDEATARRRQVWIFKRTESNVGSIVWHSVTTGQSEMLAAMEAPKKRMDFYGDSDSVGYGVETNDRHEHFCPFTENAEKAFAAVAIRKLGYDLHLIGASGWGICRGYGGEPELAIPKVWDRILIDDPKSSEQVLKLSDPDVIVVMLGDNDFHSGDPGIEFDQAYQKFARQLLDRYSRAKLFLCVGTSMRDEPDKQVRSRVTQVINSIASEHNLPNKPKRVIRIDITPYSESEGFGADWHTSEKGHERIGLEIANAIELAEKE